MRSSVTLEDAKARIFAQEVPGNLRRSAVLLFEHLRRSIDLDTGRSYTNSKALSNVLKWMHDCQLKQERARRKLTPLEQKILQMLVDGLTQQQIAIELKRNVRNTKRHFAKMRKRLGVETMYQVVALSVSYGWVDLENLDK
jgi:Response regulator containing a CheY-like receiver domain and an HTH DNA-binding domain